MDSPTERYVCVSTKTNALSLCITVPQGECKEAVLAKTIQTLAAASGCALSLPRAGGGNWEFYKV